MSQPQRDDFTAPRSLNQGEASALELLPPARWGWFAGGREPMLWAALALCAAAPVLFWVGRPVLWSLPAAAIMKLGFIALAISVAGFAQGISGFGFGLIAIALLPLLMSLKEAVGLVALLNLVVCGKTFYAMRGHYSWRQGFGLVVGACLGVPIGTIFLVRFDEAVLLRILGALMLLFSINEFLPRGERPARLSGRLGIPFGLASGSLSGAFGVGGPPAIAFAYSQEWGREQIVAVLQVVFGLSAILRLVLLGNAGFLAAPLVTVSLWSMVPLFAAISLGQKLCLRISEPVLRRAAFLFVLLMGFKYAVFG